MIEEIAPDFFRLEIPLPDLMLKNVNSYVIRGPGRNLIIDPGMFHDECLFAMQAALKELDVNIRETDFFITHFHVDHVGLALRLANEDSFIYINEEESQSVCEVGNGNALLEIQDFFHLSGFPEDHPEKIVSHKTIDAYNAKKPLPFRFIDDGDTIDIGRYRFTCVKTPGHSKGHLCLYEADKKMLIAGDHLLGDITPSIQGRVNRNPLKDYLLSLDRTETLDVSAVLPGHREPFGEHRKRIMELREHHRERNREVRSILENGGKTAYQTASRMSWSVDCDSWDSFPVLQSFFATGEAFAHLTYLEGEGEIRKEMEGQEAVFSLSVGTGQ
jgi:glyoxylase-like metal-dependent hydrolase (beta-lactamase superfamily II)